jgi:hypothetical protein
MTAKRAPRRLSAVHEPVLPAPGSYEARWRPVSLVELVRNGIPPREYHALSGGMLAVGARHLIAADQKAGKSLTVFVHCVRLAMAGETVVILDKENGDRVYGERFQQIIEAWDLDDAAVSDLDTRLRYYPWPQLREGDGSRLAEDMDDADLVVFDSQRMFLTDLGKKENDSDDYADFMAEVEPLTRQGVTTVILDNTGHEGTHARGSKSKGDINEVIFTLEQTKPFDRLRRGHATLSIHRSRHGDTGQWRMDLGGGHFGEWTRLGLPAELADIPLKDAPEFQKAVYAVLEKAAGEYVGQRKLMTEVRARLKRRTLTAPGDHAARRHLKAWAADESQPVDWDESKGLKWVG